MIIGGHPGEFWPDMYTPPDPENFPYLPGGIYNPYEPYLPGPGGPYHYPQVGKGDVFLIRITGNLSALTYHGNLVIGMALSHMPVLTLT